MVLSLGMAAYRRGAAPAPPDYTDAANLPDRGLPMKKAVPLHKRFASILAPAARAASIVMLSLGLSGCGLTGPAHGPPSPDAAATVDMGFESFTPATITIRGGQTVEWRNTSPITHTVTDDPSRARKAGDAELPPGADPFDSGDIPAGQVYLHRFTTPGTYRYFCMHHEGQGMVATVIVRQAS